MPKIQLSEHTEIEILIEHGKPSVLLTQKNDERRCNDDVIQLTKEEFEKLQNVYIQFNIDCELSA